MSTNVDKGPLVVQINFSSYRTIKKWRILPQLVQDVDNYSKAKKHLDQRVFVGNIWGDAITMAYTRDWWAWMQSQS